MKIKHIMKILVSIFLYITIILAWVGVLEVFELTYIISQIMRYLNEGILVKIFVLIYFCTFAAQVMIFKKGKSYIKKPFKILLCIIAAIVINTVIFNIGWIYISEYSREKWDNNEDLRIHMIDDLEEKYQIIGKSEREVKDILGNPAYVEDRNAGGLNGKLLSYYIGMNIIDPYMYDIILENGVVIQTEVNEH